MSGQVGFKELSEYTLGYALRSYATQNRVIHNPHVLFDQVDIHILLCKMATTKLDVEANYSFGILQKLKRIPFIKEMLVNAANSVTTAFFTTLVNYFKEKTGFDLTTVLDKLTDKRGQNMVKQMATHPIWNDLVDLVHKVQTDKARVWHLNKTIIVQSQAPTICQHHSVDCKHEVTTKTTELCLCCKRPWVLTDGYCTCCKQ